MDKKPGLMIAIGEKTDDDDDMSKMRVDSAKAVLAAIKEGDADALDEALSAHYDACAADYEEEEEEI